MALSPPRPSKSFFRRSRRKAGPGCHPVDDSLLPFNRSRGCRAFMTAAGRNGHSVACVFLILEDMDAPARLGPG